MAQQNRKKASMSLPKARQQAGKTSTSPNVSKKVGCASSSSSVFRKCLNESGYRNPFDTIQEVEEEPTELKCESDCKNAEKYEVKEKDMLFSSTNKKRTFASRNSSKVTTANALSLQLELLLQKTDYLKDAMNKKRTAIQKSLECKAKLTCKLSTNKLNCNGLSAINEATPQLHPTDISLRSSAKTKQPAAQNSTGHQTKSDILKMPIDSSSGGQNRKISWPPNGKSRMTKLSLPNIKLDSKPDKDNEVKLEKDIASEQENSQAMAAKGESTPIIESKPDSIRAWRIKPNENLLSSPKDENNYVHLKLKKVRSYTYPRSPTTSKAFTTVKQSKPSEEKRTEDCDLEEAKSTVTVPPSNNTYLRSRSKSTYKMTAGRIFKIRDMQNIDINEGLRRREVAGDNWNSIKHCRYLRNMIEAEFCTCNMCERCRKETK